MQEERPLLFLELRWHRKPEIGSIRGAQFDPSGPAILAQKGAFIAFLAFGMG